MEMIVDWEEGQEREIPKTMFPQLMNLELKSLPRLTRFCHFTHIPIELPLLSKIDISGCRSMDAFFFGPVSAPNFYFQGVSGNINQAIEFMQEEEQRKEEERIKEEERRKREVEEMAKRKGWPMKVKHEFHGHDLELIQRRNHKCDGCEEDIEVWSFCCKDCDFDLHPKCALEENKATKRDNEDGLEEGATTKGWPKKVRHELHEHELELIKRWNYICDGCKEPGKLWFFYCKDCDFYLHRKCALEEKKATKGDNKMVWRKG
ncbi:hypothetical protein Vadar_024013 [Vaccinium darrowii]|uniref:Uncharacterized protein n=1 Tax=Vaccinium darrowii TaxID=229202 RepID=A0ACB7YXS9_9ERIC|nr:hypothetical protein Vadar_024013 [Vaccinium darrowii]